ncbi:NifB/NifX family molybdenum-iron cluster-binding protein [[Clostridium] polysaccharolyticum]|uniref:Dinitrogenase iron-molybdenum cofactor n=1 Tax=[Clostridium] polysaccharolyticum TaxID=29364 RepID=A0A1I0AA90_9FIRM|nr:NifB/NifX family molybdenum-iron cluster-binding protein [[Clostridium] polysaccharolyticum]SES90936.1 Dinitrogenase iron-molybdenum cofactor [[Clostridium] polysaccharolyticum]
MYRIAIGSSNGEIVDLKFGEVSEFIIYEAEGEQYRLLERRLVREEALSQNEFCNSGCGTNGCSGNGKRCSGPSDVLKKVALIEDCRCVVCKKIGFQAQKQFEKKAVSVFDVECPVSEALDKITSYYNKVDKHQPVSLPR